MKKFFLMSIMMIAFLLMGITEKANASDLDNGISIERYNQNISGIKELTPERAVSLIKSNKKYYLYIGFAECPYCREFSENLNIFKSEAVYPIYYLNLNKSYNELSLEDQESLNKFLTSKVNLEGTPTFLKIKKKEIVNKFIGSETMIEELRSINHKK